MFCMYIYVQMNTMQIRLIFPRNWLVSWLIDKREMPALVDRVAQLSNAFDEMYSLYFVYELITSAQVAELS